MEMLLRRFISKMVRLAGFKAFSVNFSVYVLFDMKMLRRGKGIF